MNLIKSFYGDYSELFEKDTEGKIESRYELLLQEMTEFIASINAQDKLVVNERLLMHTVLEYFSDIQKVKNAHDLEHANDYKVFSYMAYWLLKRKPIQILAWEDDDENLVFANEKFVLTMLMGFLLHEKETRPLAGDDLDSYRGFIESLYYYLKFRRPDPQALELILMAFQSGKIMHDN